MKNKERRLEQVKKLLETQEIHSQEQLMDSLIEMGLHVTQATLSRDFKDLKVMKVPADDGSYIYTLPVSAQSISENTSNSFPISGFKSISFSMNLAVVKTLPGYAAGIASIIDNESFPQILGTIAGDDTIFMVLADRVTATKARRLLKNIIPQI